MSGYVDLQVNGYAGVDFNADKTTPEDVHACCERLRADGVAHILATVITDAIPAMERRIANLVRACDESPLVGDVICGIHIEGPFLSDQPGFIGAHPVDHACDANRETMQRLLDAADGRARVVTLAPERDRHALVTTLLANEGVCVAAGHSDASVDQLRSAIDSGLQLFTHLGNGCPASLPRHDNIVQRVLSLAGQLTISFIADGYHVPPFALANYVAAAGKDNCIFVTDAISAAGLGPGSYTLGSQVVEIGDDLVPWSQDRRHFVGSATTMKRMEKSLRAIGFSEPEIDHALKTRPAKLIGL